MKRLILFLTIALTLLQSALYAQEQSLHTVSTFRTSSSALYAQEQSWLIRADASTNVNLSNGIYYNSSNTSDNTLIAQLWLEYSQGMEVTIENASSWFYTSSSDPSMMVPYGLDINVRAIGEDGTESFVANNSIGYKDNGEQVSGSLTLNEENAFKTVGLSPAYFVLDIYLIIPDAASGADQSLFTGAGNADDYIAMFTVSSQESTYTILSSGYFNSQPIDDTLIFTVIPDAAAKSISIESLLGGVSIPVASYEFTTITLYGADTQSPYFIFASSSESFDDPDGQLFTMTNAENPDSSFNYIVEIDSSSGKSTPFSGTLILGNSEMSPTQTTTDRLPDGTTAVTYSDSGTIEINIGENKIPDSLAAGYYSSDIYLHVVSKK